jgi:hypothetical protein
MRSGVWSHRLSNEKNFGADVAYPSTPNLMSQILMSVHSRRVISLTRGGEGGSEWEL